MGIQLITAATLEPITVAEAKLQCQIDTSDFDTLLPLLIAAARQKAENYMDAAIMQRTVEMTLDAFPEAEIRLEQPVAWNKLHGGLGAVACPVSITSVNYVDTAGATQTLAGSAYSLDLSVWPFYLLPAVDTEWPDTRDQANAVTIRYQLGYDATSKVPADIRAWLLMTVDFMFANRESMVLDGKVAEIPNRWTDALLDPYRVFEV